MTAPMALASSTSSISTRDDPLAVESEAPDRVFYATGVLLDAKDFEDEQLYHRGRLARALAYLHGGGTIAGLKVEWQKPTATATERLIVHGGVAVDRLGRLIELPRDACLHLDLWYDDPKRTADLLAAYKPALAAVVADVFVRFVACERGKTPAFASGPFDATDAVQPARLRDGYEVTLVLRKEDNPPLPSSPWAALPDEADRAKRRAALHELLFAAWQQGNERETNGQLKGLAEHPLGEDPTAVFLARLKIPATSAGGSRPERTAGADVTIDNASRHFAYPVGPLAALLEL